VSGRWDALGPLIKTKASVLQRVRVAAEDGSFAAELTPWIVMGNINFPLRAWIGAT